MKNIYLLLFFSGSLSAAHLITGKILDIDSKAPVIGANVEFGLNGEGTATDNSGIFFIESDSKQLDKLKISHIAYLDLEYQIKNAQKILIYLEPSVINVDELIVTGTRTQKTFKDSPVLTRIIHNQEIKGSQSRNLNDIMNEIFPGYQRLKGEHTMSNEVQFNGLGTKSLLFLVDGQRVSAEFAGNMDLSIIDVNNIERIEYVDGSMSTLYGSGAMGGTINVITKKTDHFNLNANVLINDPIINSAYISSSYKLGPFDLFSSLNQNQSEGFDLKKVEYSNPTEIQKHQEEFNNITFNQKINYHRNQTDYMLSYRFHESEVNTYRVAFIDGNPFSGLATFPSFELPKNIDSAISFKIKSTLNPSTFIDFNINSEEYKKYYRYTGYNEEFWSGSYNRNGSITLNKNNSKLSYLVGIDMIEDEYRSYDVDGDGDGLIDEGSIFENGTSKNNNQYSIFINSDILLNDLNIISGLRYQYHDAYKDHIIPMISLCKKYDKYNLRSTWSKGYRAPNLKELYYNWDHPGGTVLGNSNLEPEESEYLSLSIESVKDFYYSINLYYNSLNDMISYITDGTTHTYTNFEEVSLMGMNLFYKRKLFNRGEFTFSYNYLDAYDHVLNAKLNGSNHHNLNIRLSYFISDKIKTRLAFKYSSPKQYNTCVQNCDGDNDIYELSDFNLLDFSVRYDISKFVSATFGIDNIFNYQDPNAESEQFLTLINPGRSMFISFDYNINRPYEK